MNKSEVIKEFKRAVSTLNWELDFLAFCRQILLKNGLTGNEPDNLTSAELAELGDERLQKDKYCLKKWQEWQQLRSSLSAFNDESIEQILSIYSQGRSD